MAKYYTDPATGQRVKIESTHRIRNFVVLPLVGLFLLIGIISAASGGGSAQSTPPAVPTTPASMNVELAFGQPHTWYGGETILVSAPKKFTPQNQFMNAPSGKRLVSVDVSIRNNGLRQYNVMSTSLTAQHAGRVAEQSFGNGDVLPNAELAPGQEVSFTQVYEIGADGGEFKLSVKPNAFASETVYFVGQV